MLHQQICLSRKSLKLHCKTQFKIEQLNWFIARRNRRFQGSQHDASKPNTSCWQREIIAMHSLSNKAPTFCLFWCGAIKGVEAALLQPLQWDDNNSAFLITDLPSQKKKKKKLQENDFTREESKTMAFQILEWIVSQSWRWRQFWSVAMPPALITTQWLYSKSLTQFRFLITNSHALWKDDF